MNSPTHDDIAKRAYQLWHEYGSPADRDTETWLKAERQLTAKAATTIPAAAPAGGNLAERVRSETAAESVVEYQISPAIPDQEAITAARQRQSARAPQAPHHTGLPAKPPETGKPLYARPHSS
jgi:hypothetical protein